jgi:hypothetical protein
MLAVHQDYKPPAEQHSLEEKGKNLVWPKDHVVKHLDEIEGFKQYLMVDGSRPCMCICHNLVARPCCVSRLVCKCKSRQPL